MKCSSKIRPFPVGFHCWIQTQIYLFLRSHLFPVTLKVVLCLWPAVVTITNRHHMDSRAIGLLPQLKGSTTTWSFGQFFQSNFYCRWHVWNFSIWFKALVTTPVTVVKMYTAICNEHLTPLNSVPSSSKTVQANSFSSRETILVTQSLTVHNSKLEWCWNVHPSIWTTKQNTHTQKHDNNFSRYWFLEMPLSGLSTSLKNESPSESLFIVDSENTWKKDWDLPYPLRWFQVLSLQKAILVSSFHKACKTCTSATSQKILCETGTLGKL